ncbi:MAG: hypothetical protein KDM91_15965 [Verrucomicrobiae bacterium]|nr:hypothetical protein [Verrucomicrobiae bacterium]MCP5541710.1 hypothetical protein [Akkermansiaceae bacterium]
MKAKFVPLFFAALATFIAIPHSARTQDAAAAEESLVAGGLTFKFAKPWERLPSNSPMRAGELKYDHADEAMTDVTVVLYYFGAGDGGGVEANMQRWIGQFEGTPAVERETAEVASREIHYLSAKGTYLDSMPGAAPFAGPKTPKADYMMLGAVIEDEKGSVFLKMTGPAKSVEAVKAAFKKLAESPFAK